MLRITQFCCLTRTKSRLVSDTGAEITFQACICAGSVLHLRCLAQHSKIEMVLTEKKGFVVPLLDRQLDRNAGRTRKRSHVYLNVNAMLLWASLPLHALKARGNKWEDFYISLTLLKHHIITDCHQ